MRNIIILLCFVILNIGCFGPGIAIKASFVSPTTAQFNNNGGYVDLFFEYQQPAYKYQQIGLVSSECKDYRCASEQDILDRLMHKAWINGADAVMGINRSRNHRTVIYTGIAVKYVDSNFKAVHVDPERLNNISYDIVKETRAAQRNAIIYAVTAILGLTATVVLGIMSND